MTSFRARFSHDRSAYIRLSRLFSCSSSLRRFTSVASRPPSVGPHPRGSCQLAFQPELFGRVIPWLLEMRQGLTIFAHASTGDAIKDHTEHVIWLGPSEVLNLSALTRP